MRRREFIAGLTSAAGAWPVAARAQQPAVPMIGFLSAASPDQSYVAALRQGLAEGGFVEGRDVTIEYRWAEGRFDRLPAMAADLVQRRVGVIITTGSTSALAAKAATSTMPLVFLAADANAWHIACIDSDDAPSDSPGTRQASARPLPRAPTLERGAISRSRPGRKKPGFACAFPPVWYSPNRRGRRHLPARLHDWPGGHRLEAAAPPTYRIHRGTGSSLLSRAPSPGTTSSAGRAPACRRRRVRTDNSPGTLCR
jgi:ABC transporter substrate binding protein